MTRQLRALIILDDNNRLNDVISRGKIARHIGQKTFKRKDFNVVDVLGKFKYGWIAVYDLGCSTVPMDVREQENANG